MPLHNAIANARLKSSIAVDSSCWSWLSRGQLFLFLKFLSFFFIILVYCCFYHFEKYQVQSVVSFVKYMLRPHMFMHNEDSIVVIRCLLQRQ
jgi:hypothetical protein